MDHPVLLHIGYHKTATTWMQNLLFTPRHGYRKVARHRDIDTHLVRPHGLSYDPAGLRAVIDQEATKLEPGEVPVISSELISGHPFYGGHSSDIYAQRLREILPQARVLISVRHQLKVLPSIYSQYVLRGGTQTYPEFFAGEDRLSYLGFSPDHFCYDRLVALYQDLFGAENVYVLPQESLKADIDAASQALADFAGAARFTGLAPEVRGVYAPSYPEYAMAALRRINHIQASTLNRRPILSVGNTPGGLFRAVGYLTRRWPLAPLLGGRKPITAYVAREFASTFTDSNARLRALLPGTAHLDRYP